MPGLLQRFALSCLLGCGGAAAATAPLAAERLQLERLPVNGALTQNTVSDMLQDRSGLMWFATLGGVNVYDGYEFRALDSDPRNPDALSGMLVSELFEDRDGAIWIGGFLGWLDRFDPRTGKVTHLPRELFGPTGRAPVYGEVALWQASSGEMWIGTGTGLHRFDPDTGRLVLNADVQASRPPVDEVRQILPAGADRLWLGTGDGLYLLDLRSGTLERLAREVGNPRSLPGNLVTRLLQDAAGTLWVGTTEGLARRDADGGFTRFVHDPRDPQSLGGDWVMDILQDRQGRLWIASQVGGGLSRYLPEAGGPGRFEVHRNDANDPDSLSVSDVWSLFEDRSGLIWIGTAGLGLNRINPSARRFNTLRAIPFNSNSLRHSFVWDIQETDSGEIWFSTLAGLSSYQPASGRFEHFEPRPGDIQGNQVQAMHIDRAGRFWVGGVDGHLYRFDPAQGSFRTISFPGRGDDLFSSDRIWYIGEGPDGRIWLSVPSELVALDPESATVVERIPGTELMPLGIANAVRASVVDSDGALWFGGGGAGLIRYEQGKGITATLSNRRDDQASLSDNIVRSLHESPDGTLWVGTLNGLNRMNPEDRRAGRNRFQLYTRREGLPNDTVYGILPGGDGQLWLSTNRGLSRFDIAAGTFRNYDVRDGLAGDEMNGGAELLARDGTLYFGGVNGVSWFDTRAIPENGYVPQARISAVQVDGRAQGEGGMAPAALRLPHNENELRLTFAAMDFHQPSRNRFRWRLGEQAWVETDHNSVNLAQLTPGNYRFQVHGSNNDGVWSKVPATMDIVVDAPWWATRWAFAAYLVVALLVAVVSDLSLRRKLARERRFNEELASAKSLAEANQQLALRYAQYDNLTQLPNRATLLDALGRSMRSARAQGSEVALLLLNLDRFQRINDTIGHALGDNVLKVTAERLVAALGKDDVLARVGSDEFALITSPPDAVVLDDWLEDVVARIQAVVAQGHPQLDSALALTGAIGIAVFDGRIAGDDGPGDLIGNANIALHSAKRAGPGQVRRYQTGMMESARERLNIEGRMKRALENDEFLPFYQPLVEVRTRRLTGFEALVRWQPPGAPMIFPDRFIPVAEESDLIVDIGNLMIRQVCRQLALWQRWDIAVAVNVSMRQLRSGTLVRTIREALAATGVPAQCLKVEITESAMMENVEDTAEQLRAIKSLGVRIAIDDFGTGFSSLSHLKMLPVDEMKIDRSFVADLASNKHSQKIVASIIRLAHELQLAVVAEGVEEESALLHLRGLGCDFAQGYFFDRPRAVAQIEERGWLVQGPVGVAAAGG
jgi:diguanylate cyclase (GGDEF)-like protein